MTQVVPRLNKILQYKSESSTTTTSPSVMTIVRCSLFPQLPLELCPASINQEKGTGYFAKCLTIVKPWQEPIFAGRDGPTRSSPPHPLTAHRTSHRDRPRHVKT